MNIFKRFQTKGVMDEIRCDEKSYLIWKWHPVGYKEGSDKRENSIRWGSPLHVKEGEVAVFVYNQGNGVVQEFIEGPYDGLLETDNLPVLSSIISLVYAGGTPFPAEVYFINIAKVIQVSFAIPYFDLHDAHFPDFSVPAAVRGTLTFNIKDYRNFISLHRLSTFTLKDFSDQIRDSLSRYIKGIVASYPFKSNIPLIQIERAIPEINELVEQQVKKRLESDFGVNVKAIDITAIELDKTDIGYSRLIDVTREKTVATIQAQTDANIKDIKDMQQIGAENKKETLRMEREEKQYAQHKQTEMSNLEAYQLEKQAEVGVAGASALSGINDTVSEKDSSAGGMNMGNMMAGIMLGGAVGQNLAGAINNVMEKSNNTQITPPPIPESIYYVAINGQASGPYNIATLKQMAVSGTLTKQSLLWKPGMENWTSVENIQELRMIVRDIIPPIPTID